MRRLLLVVGAGVLLATVAFVIVAFAGAAATMQSRGRLVWTSWAGSGQPGRWYMVNGDGSGYRELPGGDLVVSVALSPGGTRIAYGANGTLYTATIRPSGRLRSRPVGRAFAGFIDWSRDGRRLAFTNSEGVWTVGTGGLRARLILRQPGVSSLAWSPTGTEIAFVRNFDGESMVRQWRRDIYVVHADGTGRHRVAVAYGYTDEPVSWSPDGGRILFSSKRRDEDANGTIYALNLRTGTRVSLGRGNAPSYSPDGRHIAFTIRASSQSLGEMAIASTSGSARRLLKVASLSGPVWSPDGTQVAGSGYAINGLVAVRIDGAKQRKLAPVTGEVKGLAWEG